MKKATDSFYRIMAIADKEWIQIRRDARSLVLSLLLPVLLILLFGYALTMDVKHVGTVVLDQDRSSFSRLFLEGFSHTEYLSIDRYVNSYREIDAMLDRGEAVMAVVIPAEFGKRYKAGKSVDVQLIVDGSDSTSATVAMGYVKTIVYEFNTDRKLDELNRAGITGVRMPVDVRTRIWYNPELKSKNFIVPGIIVIIMSIISALITSLTISREWERGSMETLITTPLRKYEIFAGKMVPYVFIALFDIIMALCVGHFIFRVPVKGNFIELYLVALLFLAGTSSLGILISSATRSQVLSVQVAIIVTYLPSLILSGYVFPIKNMPSVVQAVTYVIPARYLMTYMKGVMMKGIGYQLLWAQILFLFIFAVVVCLISMRMLSFKLPDK
jgi:ABC-2 type transport system permease protein